MRKALKSSKPKPKATPGGVSRRRNPGQPTELSAFVSEQLREESEKVEDYITAEQLRTSEELCPDNPSEMEEVEPPKLRREDVELAEVIARIESGRANYGSHVTTVLKHHVLWSSPSPAAEEMEIQDKMNKKLMEEQHVLEQSQLVTGKDRVEMKWGNLDAQWRNAFTEPIIKGFQVYFDHDALQGVPEGQWVDPLRVLPSRMVLTNKGEKELEKAQLKARWVFGGHRDPDAGQYQTSSPTVSLVGHNLLNFIAVQNRWVVNYEDVSAAFLQGQELPAGREIYVRVPQGYPPETMSRLKELIGKGMRYDLVLKLVKGGFGLPESPRLWYLEYRRTLISLGGHELRLLPGFFCFYNAKNELIGLACIHVDDTRYAGSPEANSIWAALHEKLNFGKKRMATEGWSKFCGRYERQDPKTYEMEYSMDSYCEKIPVIQERHDPDKTRRLTPEERKGISSVVGQLAWAARQCRSDLSYGCSHIQQLAGQGDPEALAWVNKVVRRAKQSVPVKVRNLSCSLDDIIFLHQRCSLRCPAKWRKSRRTFGGCCQP